MTNAVGLAITSSGAGKADTPAHHAQTGATHQEFAGLMRMFASDEEPAAAANRRGSEPIEGAPADPTSQSAAMFVPAASPANTKSLLVFPPKVWAESNSKRSELLVDGPNEAKSTRKKHVAAAVKAPERKPKSAIANSSTGNVAVTTGSTRLSSLPASDVSAPILSVPITQAETAARDLSRQSALGNSDIAPPLSAGITKATTTEPTNEVRLGLPRQVGFTSSQSAGSTQAGEPHEFSTASERGIGVQSRDRSREFDDSNLQAQPKDTLQNGNHGPEISAAAGAGQSEAARAALIERASSPNPRHAGKTVADRASVDTAPDQIRQDPIRDGIPVPSTAIGSESWQADTTGASSGSSSLPNRTTARGESAAKGRATSVEGVNSPSAQPALESPRPSQELPIVQVSLHTDRLNGVHGNPTTPQGQDTFAALDSGPRPVEAVWTRTESHAAEAGYQDPTLGWVSVRAQVEGGGVHAAVVPDSDSASQALSGQLSGLRSYLTEHRVPIETLSIANPESRLDGQGAAAQGGNQQGQGTDQQSQPSPQRNFPESAPQASSDAPERSAEASVEVDLSPPSPQVGLGRNGAHISVVV